MPQCQRERGAGKWNHAPPSGAFHAAGVACAPGSSENPTEFFPRPARHPLAWRRDRLPRRPWQANPFSKAVFFGDSLTDAGYSARCCRPRASVTGQFTTNPGWVWSQQVANYYGLNGSPTAMARTVTTTPVAPRGGGRPARWAPSRR
jgi:hypothetical protein